MRDLTPNDPHDVPPEYPTDPLGCGCAFAPDSKELAFTENLDPEPAITTNADIFTLDLTDAAAKPVKVSTSLGGDFIRPIRRMGSIWRGARRRGLGMRAISFGWWFMTGRGRRSRICCRSFDLTWVDEFAWGPMILKHISVRLKR